MGRSTTPTFAVRLRVPGFAYTPAGWDTRRCGRPSDDALARYVREFEASCQPGGANEHLGPQRVASATVVRQSTGERVASYSAPLFEVLA